MTAHNKNTGFQFDSRQGFQLDAINAVVDLFGGQLRDEGKFRDVLQGVSRSREDELAIDTAQEVGAIGNRLLLGKDIILENLQKIQDRNGLEVSEKLAGDSGRVEDDEKLKLDFDVEMETGTGKTYVYLRTAFELAENYGFTKFIILVPSVAIREGVNTSIRLMREHFQGLYPAHPFDASVYSGGRAEEVQAFATATNVQFMVMTIAAIRGDKNTRIIHQYRDKLNGLRPLDYLKATRPVIIMDEPQNMESELAKSAVGELNPMFTLRYSATHKQLRNLVYRLDPVDAHEKNLVKQIVVSEVLQQGADAAPYMKLLEVKYTKSWVAKLELACRKANGSVERKAKSVKLNQDLAQVTNNPVYDGWCIHEMSIADGLALASIELNQHGFLFEGEAIGGATGAVYKEMIRETVREHLRKEAILRAKGIKVLSLFFVDKVASYLGEGNNNEDANGDFVRWFDEVFVEERDKSARYRELLPQEPRELRRAYFSQLKKKGKVEFRDSSGTTRADDDAYELIMQDKQRLLDADEPVRFIFSHSALREGWDNPNVFQICSLREMGQETERRQTLGRGLRLPVAKTAQGYQRVADRGIATLTVIANESYAAFAQSLQIEYQKVGVAIGVVRKNEFARLARLDADGKATEEPLGFKDSLAIFKHLDSGGFIKDGKLTAMFRPLIEGFTLNLPEQLKAYEDEVIVLMGKVNIEHYVKSKSNQQTRKLNKALYLTDEFQRFWSAISQKTTYRVQIERAQLVNNIVEAMKGAPDIAPLRIEVTRAGMKVLRGGTKGKTLSTRSTELTGSYDLPDVIHELQQATSLTRKTLVDVLIGSGRLSEFVGNPHDFIAMARRCVQGELAKLLIEGIQYEKIDGSIYELRELQSDGQEEKERFLDQMYKVENQQKTDFDYVVYDSGVEHEFAQMLDSREDVKLFMKLPARFEVPTPVGMYNPDWAIIKQVDGEDRIYMIRETKSTLDRNKLRPSELAKIDAAKKHFVAIGVEDYEVAAPEGWHI